MELVELTSASLVSKYSQDRRTFVCVRSAGMFGARQYFQVLALPKGLLFIYLPTAMIEEDAAGTGVAVFAGAFLAGKAGAAIARKAMESAPVTRISESYQMASDEELLEVCRNRRYSFVVAYDEFVGLTIDPTRRNAAGVAIIRFKARNVGKYELQLKRVEDVLSAVDVFEMKIPEVAEINVQLDVNTRTIVRKR